MYVCYFEHSRWCWSRMCILDIADIAGHLTFDRGFRLYWGRPFMIFGLFPLDHCELRPMGLDLKNMCNTNKNSHMSSILSICSHWDQFFSTTFLKRPESCCSRRQRIHIIMCLKCKIRLSSPTPPANSHQMGFSLKK
jgi:hypothetical protein